MSRYDKEMNCDFKEEIAIAQGKIAVNMLMMKAISMSPISEKTDLKEEKNNLLDSGFTLYKDKTGRLMIHSRLNLIGIAKEEEILGSRRCADGYSDDYYLIGIKDNLDIFTVKKVENKENYFQLEYVQTFSEERPR